MKITLLETTTALKQTREKLKEILGVCLSDIKDNMRETAKQTFEKFATNLNGRNYEQTDEHEFLFDFDTANCTTTLNLRDTQLSLSSQFELWTNDCLFYGNFPLEISESEELAEIEYLKLIEEKETATNEEFEKLKIAILKECEPLNKFTTNCEVIRIEYDKYILEKHFRQFFVSEKDLILWIIWANNDLANSALAMLSNLSTSLLSKMVEETCALNCSVYFTNGIAIPHSEPPKRKYLRQKLTRKG
jgi:hypothetical protein